MFILLKERPPAILDEPVAWAFTNKYLTLNSVARALSLVVVFKSSHFCRLPIKFLSSELAVADELNKFLVSRLIYISSAVNSLIFACVYSK